MRQSSTLFLSAPSRLAFAAIFAFAGVIANAVSFAAKTAGTSKIGRIEIGFKNQFKVGFWTPILVEVEGGNGGGKLRVEVQVADSDGVPTIASAPVVAATPGGKQATAVVYTKVGRVGGPLEVSLFDDERRIDTQTLRPDKKARPASVAVSLPATAEFVVSLGSTPFGLHDAFSDRESDSSQSARAVVELTRIADLPNNWFGYEAVDVLVLSTGDGKLCRELAADAIKLAALKRWVELGGRLIVMCNGQIAKELLAPGGALANFAPGKLAEVVRLPETGPLEHFAGAATTISIPPGAVLRVPRFTDVDGNIEAYLGKKPTDLPLVMRTAHGLGEVAFAGVDFSLPPLVEWAGRGEFIQAMLRPYLLTNGPGDTGQRLVTRGYNDLGGAFRQQFGQTFTSVAPIGFAVVAALALLYIAFLGPLDYLVVNRWLRRPLVAWITFPLIVVAFCGGAMSLAAWRNGGAQTHANRIELVDVDTTAGRARGTLWTTIFSPEARKFDLSVKGPELPADATKEKDVLLSWWGLPGAGIGGMQSGGVDLGMIDVAYRYGKDRNSLIGVPILASATKSLITRWAAPVATLIDADLTDQGELAVGSITNQTGMNLRNVRLFYGTWAYRLGDLDAGTKVDVGDQLSPRKVKTIVTHDALGDSGAPKDSPAGQLFAPEKATAKQILSLMMFYEAAGGYGFAHLPNRYQAFCDMSRTLELGRAILVAEVANPAIALMDDTTGAAVGDKGDLSTVIYRFVLPVKRRGGS